MWLHHRINTVNCFAHSRHDAKSLNLPPPSPLPSHLVVKGIVRQVTYDPGELSLYLLWPGADPISFTAIGEHYDDFQVIKPTITLDLTRSRYSFAGEVSLWRRDSVFTRVMDFFLSCVLLFL